MAVAYFKARSVFDESPERTVLGADTIVVCGGEMLGKPRDLADARRMLLVQAGVESEVVTGVAWVQPNRPRVITADVTKVWMRNDRDVIEDYLAGGDWAGKAGAYGIQNIGDALVERIEGSYSNVVGLPVERVLALIADP